ncbi:MAG: LysR family transcriptional regulator [Saccharofermentanales bacterium]|jgi:DNA-binding transcriptional LysR family regulator|nr:LysR family transcriptional regulator [Clostridiaceae bacterium]
MTFPQIDCFLAVLKHGSIAGAARTLFLSPQVVSQHIARLEKELSVRLFSRSRTGMELTAQGQDFYEFVVRWIGLHNRTLKSIHEVYDSLPRCFNIGVSEYIDSVGAISGGIVDFSHKRDATDIRCTQKDNQGLLVDIFSGKLDTALVCGDQIAPYADLSIEPVAKEDLRLYISGVTDLPDDLQLDSPELQAVFRSLPHVNTPYGQWSAQGWAEISRRVNTFLGISPYSYYSVPNFRSVLACIRTIPCTIVCDARFGYLREEDGIYNIPLDADFDLCCIWLKTNENPLVQEFIEHMKWYYS